MRPPRAGCCATSTPGEARLNAYLEDHAFLLEALLTLSEATFEDRWFDEARTLGDALLERFADPERGGFFSTSSDHEQLLTRRKDLEDAPISSGGSAAALGLLRLAALTGEHRYRRSRSASCASCTSARHSTPPPSATSCRRSTSTSRRRTEVALAGDGARDRARPRSSASVCAPVVLAGAVDGAPSLVPLLEGRGPVDGRAAAGLCERFAYKRPMPRPGELRALLDGGERLLP